MSDIKQRNIAALNSKIQNLEYVIAHSDEFPDLKEETRVSMRLQLVEMEKHRADLLEEDW